MRRFSIAILVVLIVSILFLFVGCTTQEKTEAEIKQEQIETELEEWCELEFVEDYGYYSIYAHKKTGVCYMQYFGSYKCALTVMLNADGSPVTIEQIQKDCGVMPND